MVVILSATSKASLNPFKSSMSGSRTTTMPLYFPKDMFHYTPGFIFSFDGSRSYKNQLLIHSRRRNHVYRKLSCLCLSETNQAVVHTINRSYREVKRRKESANLVSSEGRDGDEEKGLICPGCGVFMQDRDPNLPGYYQKKKDGKVTEKRISDEEDGLEDSLIDEFDEEEKEAEEEQENEGAMNSSIEGKLVKSGKDVGDFENDKKLDWDSDEWEDFFVEEDKKMRALGGFALPGFGYGSNIEWIEKKENKSLSKAERKRLAREAQREKEEVLVCARCHSLRNYRQVKNQVVENLIPDFDFDRLVATRLMKPTGNVGAPVVVMVVDCVDFDGSFPRQAAKSLFKAQEGSKYDRKLEKNFPKLILVATKVDLLPSQISPTRLDKWVRHRAREGGAPKLSGLYLVSSLKDLGVRNLLAYIKKLAGPRGNVWVIGAQNAGKSTLINTFAKKEGAKLTKLTEAPIPGTTLGILRIRGVLPANAKMYDTPGLLHPYLMSMRLNRDEQKMIEIRKELRPRTYRMKVGQTVHVGALMRLDLNQASVETIYMTIWASPNISLHMGKTENADETFTKHGGVRLQPPIGAERISELGKWKEREITVSGSSWDVKSIDIAASGLGWFSLGLKGNATLTLWTYEGIEITTREPLVLDRAPSIERPGFWLPKAISEAIGAQSKLTAQKNEEDSRGRRTPF